MDSKLNRVCHDLKTERPDVGRPLPGILRILPIGLYLSGAAALAFSALFLWQFRAAREARDSHRTTEANAKAKQAQLVATTDSITKEAKRAEDARKWVMGSDPMQEVLLNVVRSMRPTSALSDLSLIRDKDDPRKIAFTMQVISGGPTQLDETVGQLANALNYRPYFAQQKQEKGGEIAYSATLIKQERKDSKNEQAAATPAR